MFQSLYNKTLQSRPDVSPESPFRWPATYLEGMETMEPNTWRLSVDGLVAEPAHFSLDELMALPKAIENRRMVCAEGWTHRTAWEGVLLQLLVNRVKPFPEAKAIRQTDLSGHVEYLPLEDALQHRALLAYGVRNQRFPALYGGPLRLMVFHRLSYKGLGQLARLEFVAEEADGFWERKGYSRSGEILPGDYYAMDLRELKPVKHAGEITEY